MDINTRSMNVDSELNIFHENGAVTRALRERLWGLHTGDAGGGNFSETFEQWGKVIMRNTVRQQGGTQPPVASLVDFFRVSNDRSYDD